MSGTQHDHEDDEGLTAEQIRAMMHDGDPQEEVQPAGNALVDPNQAPDIGELIGRIQTSDLLKTDEDNLDPDEELRRALEAEYDEFGGAEEGGEDLQPRNPMEDALGARINPGIRDIYSPPEISRVPANRIAGTVEQVAGNGNALVANAYHGVEPRWMAMRQLGLPQEFLNLGRSIFRSASCFRAMEELCQGNRRDPFGEIKVILHAPGAPIRTNSREEVDGMAQWIMHNGRIIDHDQIEFPRIMGRVYRPNVILACSEEDSFMMVQDAPERGAPGATYIYSWKGGLRHYNDPEAIRQTAQNFGGEFAVRANLGRALTAANNAAPHALAAPNIIEMQPDISFDDEPDDMAEFEAYMNKKQLENQAATAKPVIDMPIIDRVDVASPVKAEVVQKEASKAKTVDALPEPLKTNRTPVDAVKVNTSSEPKTSTPAPAAFNFVQAMLKENFKMQGTENGPVLKKNLDDGTTMYISSAQRKGLAVSTLFHMELMDETNSVLEDAFDLTAQQVLGKVSEYSSDQNLKP